MRIRLTLALLTALAAASCDRPTEPADAPKGGGAPAPAATAGAYAATGDLSGYYMPTGEARFGKWTFDHLFVGQAAEFQSWRGGDQSATFAPVMLQFDDATSPMVQTEMGEAHGVTARVLPTSYEVSDTRVKFEGRSAELGAVTFDGRLDPGALATARRNLGDEGVVVTGSLKVGDAPAQRVSLRWWMGD